MSKVSTLQPREPPRYPSASLSVDVIAPSKQPRIKPIQNEIIVPTTFTANSQTLSALEELKKINARLQGHVDTLQRELAAVKESLMRSEAEVTRYKQLAGQWQARANDQKQSFLTEIDKNARQRQEQEAELDSLRAFLDTHDMADPSSIANQLSTINDLVEQLATDLSFRWNPPKERVALRFTEEFSNRMNSVLGVFLVNALRSCNPSGDGATLLLQYAFQAAAVFSLSQIFEVGRHRSKRYRKINDLEKDIQKNEIQPVYGRWRSLTHSYLHASGKDQELSSSKELMDWMSFDIFNSAQLFGIPLTSRDHQTIRRELEAPLSEIVNKMLKLATTTATQTISRDYELHIPAWGYFEPSHMETSFRLSNPPNKDQVVATVGFGMMSYGKPGRQQVKLEKKLFRKAKVVTETTLNEILAPPPARGKQGRKSPAVRNEPRQSTSTASSHKRTTSTPAPVTRKEYTYGIAPGAPNRVIPSQGGRTSRQA